MTAFRFDVEGNTVRVFPSRRAADQMGNSQPTFDSIDGMLRTTITNGNMINLYNSLTNETLTKFRDRETGAKRLWDVLQALSPPEATEPAVTPDTETPCAGPANGSGERGKEDKAAKAKRRAIQADENIQAKAETKALRDAGRAAKVEAQEEARAARAASGNMKRGRKAGSGMFFGKILHALKDVNPRRAGSRGFWSYEILRTAPNGIAYADYLAAGGRSVDLHWDVDKHFADAK